MKSTIVKVVLHSIVNLSHLTIHFQRLKIMINIKIKIRIEINTEKDDS